MNAQVVRTFDQLPIDVDMILRGQGADPAVIRQRRPRLVDLAEQALIEGLGLIEPRVIYQIWPVEKVTHDQFSLAGDVQLKGALLAQHLASAQQIALMICTLGSALERRVTELMESDPVYAFALNGFGSAAAETLGLAICTDLEKEAQLAGLCSSIPLSPGMLGWSVDEGQSQIFSALDGSRIGVTLNQSCQMLPHKSVSMLMGISALPFHSGRPCDFCSMRETCRFQNRDTHFGTV